MVLRITVVLSMSETWVYLYAKKKYLAYREKFKVQKKWMIEENEVTENGRGNKIQVLLKQSFFCPFT